MKSMKLALGIAGLMLALPALADDAMPAGDAKAGEQVFHKCQLCHSGEKGVNKIGPSLFGVVGRHSATIENYNYSDAMKAADKTWTPDVLFVYLKNPRGMVPGTKMTFVGLPDPKDRADVIAYLETLK